MAVWGVCVLFPVRAAAGHQHAVLMAAGGVSVYLWAVFR